VFIGYIHARLVVFSYNIFFIVYLLVFIFDFSIYFLGIFRSSLDHPWRVFIKGILILSSSRIILCIFLFLNFLRKNLSSFLVFQFIFFRIFRSSFERVYIHILILYSRIILFHFGSSFGTI
jgi:hypothetical protein